MYSEFDRLLDKVDEYFVKGKKYEDSDPELALYYYRKSLKVLVHLIRITENREVANRLINIGDKIKNRIENLESNRYIKIKKHDIKMKKTPEVGELESLFSKYMELAAEQVGVPLEGEEFEKIIRPIFNYFKSNLNAISDALSREQIATTNKELGHIFKIIEIRLKRKYRDLPPGYAALLVGPSGTGKTTFAKSLIKHMAQVSQELNRKWVYVEIDASKLLGMYLGQSEKITKAVFFTINKLIDDGYNVGVYLDEIGGLFSRRSTVFDASMANVLNIFKQETGKLVDKAMKSSDAPGFLLMLASTNYPEDLDENIIRRFGGNIIYVGLPHKEEIKEIIRNDLSKLKDIIVGLSENDLDEVALLMRKRLYSIHDIVVNVLNRAKEKAIIEADRRGTQAILTKDILIETINKVNPTNSKERIMEMEKWLRARSIVFRSSLVEIEV